jgi:hemin uptake protein HemP
MNAITRFDPAPQIAPQTAPVHDVYALTRGGQLAQILLDGKTYQLRITRAGKLILTK